jgi:hypothetical protein
MSIFNLLTLFNEKPSSGSVLLFFLCIFAPSNLLLIKNTNVMKKNILKLMIVAICAVTLTACPKEEKTTKDYLTGAKNGWVITKGTFDHTYVTTTGDPVNDLIEDEYLLECELDDIMTFLENGSQTINPGKNTCDDFGYQKEVAATWSLTGKTLTCQLPFFYNDAETSFDAEPEVLTVVSIDDKEMVLRGTYKVEELPTKEDFVFTLTYKAK